MRNSQNRSKQKIEELEYIISNIPDLVIRINLKGQITFINAASILFFNKSPDLLIGQNLEKLVTDEGMAPLDPSLVQRIFETRQAEIIEGELYSPSGVCRNIEIRILPEPHGLSNERHLVLLIRDITLKKETERIMIQAKRKAEESDLLKSAFLANMSHEIRTPLNAIVGFSQIILDDDITRQEQERFYGYINQNSNQLISLVNDIIDLSKLESNQLVIKESAANLNQIVEEMKLMAENETKTREKGHILIFLDKKVPDEDELIMVDHYRLKQILTNLLINAIKFTPKGYIQFGYRLKENNTILFFVRDTGIGIPKNKQGEVFQYFHQLENTLNRANTGTGLGLAICKRLVELMKGTIWLQSEPGKGTSFFFSIPYRKA
ncbi:MAG: PAS domain S-box protein [Porphyromonadaceae bacterium]|nr:MAG: PAS domain S-box protein [Porphyromonadaceae bacterium]